MIAPLKSASSPILCRVAPFAVFVILTSLEGRLGEASRYWIYLAKTLVGGWMLWAYRGAVTEMRWKFSLAGGIVGVVVFVLWVGLDGLYPKWGSGTSSWNPPAFFGPGTVSAWAFIAIRLLGSSIVVPPLEEIFYRSFLYRYLISPDFEKQSLGHFNGKAFVIAAGAFGLVHGEWLPGILCGLAYQGLVVSRGRLGDAMFAHATTNLLLGLWVVGKGAWQFW